MDIEFEILTILAVSILFTIISLLLEDIKKAITFKFLSAFSWICLGISFLATVPQFIAFSLFFVLIGVLFIANALMEVADMLGEKPEKDWYKRD